MKKILIAIDYNPSAEKVADAGYALARAIKAEVTLVHVVADAAYYAIPYSPIMGYNGNYTESSVALYQSIEKEANDFLAAAARHLGDPGITTKALSGNVDDAILDYCKHHKIDLVVMGSHSHKGLDRLFVTDVAARVLKHSKIPLLFIPTTE